MARLSGRHPGRPDGRLSRSPRPPSWAWASRLRALASSHRWRSARPSRAGMRHIVEEAARAFVPAHGLGIFAAGGARKRQRPEAGGAQVLVERRDRRARRPRRGSPPPESPRPASRRRAPPAAPVRTCRCGSETRRRRRRRKSARGPRRAWRRERSPSGHRRASSSRAGPSPTTTLVPGRSSDRNAAMFFSTANRPTVRKIGRSRPRLASGARSKQPGVDPARPAQHAA